MATSDEVREIYILLKGDNSDRKDGGLCDDVKENTKFRKAQQDIKNKTYLMSISAIIGLIIKVLYDVYN